MRRVLVTQEIVLNDKIVTKYVSGIGPQVIIDPEDNRVSAFGCGSALSGDGNVLVIAASNQDSDGNNCQGVVYVYRNIDNVWVMEEKLTHDSEGWYSGFGTSVAVSDDGRVIAVGIPRSDADGAVKCGSVRVYTYDNVWSFADHLSPESSVADKGFGTSVAVSGNGKVIAVGAVSHTEHILAAPDSVTLYGLTDDIWRLTQTINNPREITRGFGSSVCLSQDAVILTIATLGISGGVSIGTVDMYVVSVDSFSYYGEIACPDGVFGDQYGASISLSDDGYTMVVGAPNSGDGDNPTGGVYVFETHRNHRVVTRLPGLAGGVNYGKSVAVSGNGQFILIGGGSDTSTAVCAGSVTLWLRVDDSWVESINFTSSDAGTRGYGTGVCVDADGGIYCVANRANEHCSSAVTVYALQEHCD